MGSESTSPRNLTDDKSQNPEPPKPMDAGGQGASGEITRETSHPSVFVNSEPIREDQVQNAVKFLSHPKVRGSPVMYRRSFLEKKGLSKEEIDEAFRRVPDPPPPATTTQVANPNQDAQTKPDFKPSIPAQTPQTAVSAPIGVVSTVATLSRGFHWYHALYAIGLLAASGAGTALVFKNAVVPRLKAWIRKVVLEEEDDSMKKTNSKPSLVEEAAAAAKAAAVAAADVAKASQEMLNSKIEEKKYHEAFINLLDVQVEEMKSMSSAIRRLEGTREVTVSSNRQIEDVKSTSRNGSSNTGLRNSLVDQDDHRFSQAGLKQQARANGTMDFDLGSERPSSAPVSTDPSGAPHPKNFMEIMAMVQRGEKPPGIKEINDLPPNPNQLPSNPRLAPRVKPWEVSQAQNGSYYGDGSSSRGQDNTPTYQFNGDSTENSWQRKNVRISEIEPEDESKTSSYRATNNEQQVVRRTWVPPQPPPIAMPEAATAIRQPKPAIQTDRSDDDKLIARPSDEIDELQRITTLSESGGEVDINNVNAGQSLPEVREELEDGIEAN